MDPLDDNADEWMSKFSQALDDLYEWLCNLVDRITAWLDSIPMYANQRGWLERRERDKRDG